MADDEWYEADARDWLDSVDVPPPRLEVAQIVQTGRSQVRRRRMLAVGGTAAVLAAVAAIPAMVPVWPSGGGQSPAVEAPLPVLNCEFSELPLPDNLPALGPSESRQVSITAMDPTGRYILGTIDSGRLESRYGDIPEPDPTSTEAEIDPEPAAPDVTIRTATVLWDSGTSTYFPGLREARDVNSHGVIVGGGWVYRDGEVEDLPVPEGYDSVYPMAVNDAGDVAGTASIEGPENSVNGSAVVRWPASDPSQPEILAQRAQGALLDVYAITDDGTVVGFDAGEGEHRPPYMWDADGERHELPLPSGTISGTVYAARGDWAVGGVDVPVSHDGLGVSAVRGSSPDVTEPSLDAEGGYRAAISKPALWNLRTGTVVVIDSVSHDGTILVADVSAAGEVVLVIPDAAGITGQTVLVKDGDAFSLPVPTDALYPAQAISDDGTAIAGSSVTEVSEGQIFHAGTPVVWRC